MNFGQELGAKQNQPKSTDRTFEWVERQQVANLMEEQPMSSYQAAASGAAWVGTSDKQQAAAWMGTSTSSSTSLSPKNSCDKSSNSSFSLFTGF